MSTLKVTAERLEVRPHPNADRLELARVGLYNAVVPKGVYSTGDVALYIPEQAVLPDELIEDLGLTGKLAGKAKNRVKAVRLRGEVSQGIVCRPSGWSEPWMADEDREKFDYGPQLGIEKWVPEIPPHMAGEVEPAPELIRWIDIESLKRYPDIFTPGEPVVATEKIHGTACLLTVDTATGRAWVSSKGHGSSSVALVDSATNLYWRAVRAHGLIDKLLAFGWSGPTRPPVVALFGEVFGAGVQDLHYGANARRDETIGYRAFDMAYRRESETVWLDPDWFAHECADRDIPAAPVLYDGPFDLDALTEVASGQTAIRDAHHIREGVVIRAKTERRSDVTGGRAIAKLVSDDYLLRGGDATEFE